MQIGSRFWDTKFYIYKIVRLKVLDVGSLATVTHTGKFPLADLESAEWGRNGIGCNALVTLEYDLKCVRDTLT